jgi:hypothetical protein
MSGIIHSKPIDYWYKLVEVGVVIHDRPWTYITNEVKYLGTIKLLAYLMFGFFTPFETNFYLFHITTNGVLLFQIIVLFF